MHTDRQRQIYIWQLKKLKTFLFSAVWELLKPRYRNLHITLHYNYKVNGRTHRTTASSQADILLAKLTLELWIAVLKLWSPSSNNVFRVFVCTTTGDIFVKTEKMQFPRFQFCKVVQEHKSREVKNYMTFHVLTFCRNDWNAPTNTPVRPTRAFQFGQKKFRFDSIPFSLPNRFFSIRFDNLINLPLVHWYSNSKLGVIL